MNVIIDLEFSGLDNSYVTDHDITHVKLLCVETRQKVCKECRTEKPVSVYDRLHGVERYRGTEPFSEGLFNALLSQIGGIDPVYHGYSVEQDRKMLDKCGVHLDIRDLQEATRLNPDYELQMAGCASMEAAYYLLTGCVPPLDTHHDERELDLLLHIYQAVANFDPERQNEYLTVMPWGHCAGMPIDEYIARYRRAADGYRFNNDDLLAASLTHYVPAVVYASDRDDEDGHDDRDEDDDDWE